MLASFESACLFLYCSEALLQNVSSLSHLLLTALSTCSSCRLPFICLKCKNFCFLNYLSHFKMPGGSPPGTYTALFTCYISWTFKSSWAGRSVRLGEDFFFCSTSSALQAGNETRGLMLDYLSSPAF